MSNLLDSICKFRDILEYKDYKRLPYIKQLSRVIFDGIHLNIKRKTVDYKYELDFTSQDLRETAKAISDTFKRWDNIMCPDKQIKKIAARVENNRIDLNPFCDETLQIMAYRRDYTQVLTELRSLLEYHAVFLYYLEEASEDKFALNYTERLL